MDTEGSEVTTYEIVCVILLNKNCSESIEHLFLAPFSQAMQYVISTYMKHLGVKVKEPRGLEHKRPRINFLPKIKVRLQTGIERIQSANICSAQALQ